MMLQLYCILLTIRLTSSLSGTIVATKCRSSTSSPFAMYTPQTLTAKFVAKGYQFWGANKARRVKAGLSRGFVNNTLKPFDEVDFIFRQLEIAKVIYGGVEAEIVNSYTQQFCSQLPTIVRSVFISGVFGAFYGPEYCDSFVLQNYIYYYIVFNTDITLVYKIRSQVPSVLGMSYATKFGILILVLILLPILAFDLAILRRMTNKGDSSAFTIHIYLCCLDPVVYLSILLMAFPVGFLTAQGSPCVDMGGRLVDVYRHPWTMDVPYRIEESLTCLRNTLLTMLMADRTLAIASPVTYMKHFHADFAKKCFIIAVLVNVLLAALLFSNSWYLTWFFDQQTTYKIFAVARTLHLAFIVAIISAQAILPMILTAKLVSKYHRSKNVHNNELHHRTNAFLFLYTFYNIVVASSLYAFLVCDTFFQLLLMGHCNRCLYFYEGLAIFGRYTEIIIAYFQPLVSSVGLFLHVVFLQSYRTECVKLLRGLPVIRRFPGLKITNNSSLISVITANAEQNRLRRAMNPVATARWATATNTATIAAIKR